MIWCPPQAIPAVSHHPFFLLLFSYLYASQTIAVAEIHAAAISVMRFSVPFACHTQQVKR